jgi:hypothetical protein
MMVQSVNTIKPVKIPIKPTGVEHSAPTHLVQPTHPHPAGLKS